MVIKSIESKQDLGNVLKRVNELWDIAEPNTREGNELDALVTIVEDYELSLIVSERENQNEIQVDIGNI